MGLYRSMRYVNFSTYRILYISPAITRLHNQCYHDMDGGPLNYYLIIPIHSTSGTFSTQILRLIIPRLS